MAENKVEVTLAAIDNITEPVRRATGALDQFSKAIKKTGDDGASLAAGAKEAEGALGTLENRAFHKFEHVGFRMVIGQMAEMVGASHNAHGAVRLLEAGLFAAFNVAGILSGGMVLVVAGAAALSAAFQTSSKSAEEEAKRVAELTDNLLQFYDQQLKVTQVGREMAALHVEELAKKIRTSTMEAEGLEKQIGALDKQLRHQIDTADEGAQMFNDMWLTHKTGADVASDATTKVTQAQTPLREKLVMVRAEIEKNTEAQNKYRLMAQGASEAAIRAADKEAEERKRKLDDIVKVMREADKQMQEIDKRAMDERKRSAEAVAKDAARVFADMGKMAAEAAFSTEKVFVHAMNTVIDAVSKMAMDWVEKHIIMAQASALAAEVSSKGILGLITGFAGIAAIAALGETLKHAITPGQRISEPGGSAIGGTSATAAATAGTTGGRPVASAQQSVNNNISVNLGVQAMDLSSISDMQLKAMAYRIGRVLREASATGQFSLQGA